MLAFLPANLRHVGIELFSDMLADICTQEKGTKYLAAGKKPFRYFTAPHDGIYHERVSFISKSTTFFRCVRADGSTRHDDAGSLLVV